MASETMSPNSRAAESPDSLELGVWTPWAEVLCAECHNGLPEEERQGARGTVTLEVEYVPRDEAAVGECDHCGKRLAVGRSDVAQLQAMQRAGEGLGLSLQQTGGMCVALGAEFGGHELLVTVDERDADEDEAFVIGVYAGDACEGEPLDWWDGLSMEATLAKVRDVRAIFGL